MGRRAWHGQRIDVTAQPAASAARIRVRSLAKRYGTLEVFRGIDFDVGEREIVAIVGPSGCGKTTLLRCVDGLLPVDEGEIWCGRERVTQADRRDGDGVPAFRLVSVEDGLRQRRLRAAHGRRRERREIAARVPRFIKLVGLDRLRAAPIPTRCRAACSSAAGSTQGPAYFTSFLPTSASKFLK